MSPDVTGFNDHAGLMSLDITLKSDKPFKLVKIQISTNDGSITYQEEKTPHAPKVTFHTPQYLPLSARLALQIRYYHFLTISKTINIEGSVLFNASSWAGEEGLVWKCTYGKLELAMELSGPLREIRPVDTEVAMPREAPRKLYNRLPLTTDRLLELCPRFRILVLGKSGSGKSSLINKVFGVADVYGSDGQPRTADLDRGVLSEKNPRFILHDGGDFERGESNAVSIVQSFIQRRNQMPEIKDKLHAIWICIEVPVEPCCLLEANLEKFLQLKAAGKLGQVPIILVFTKYEGLVNDGIRHMMTPWRYGDPTIIEAAEKIANSRLKKEYTPFEALLGKAMPYVPVSTFLLSRYIPTLCELIKLTFVHVERYIPEAALVMGISQRFDPSTKFRTVIQLGTEKSWRGLGVTSLPYLEAVHTDIVNIWNLNGNHRFLHSSEFKTLISNSVEQPEEHEPKRLRARCATMFGMLPIVVPSHRRTDLRQIMTYILGLTLVMRNLQWFQGTFSTTPPRLPDEVINKPFDRAVPITYRIVELAFQLYLTSNYRDHLLHRTNGYTGKVYLSFQDGHDAIVKRVLQLIDSSASDETLAQQRHIRELWYERKYENEWDLPPSYHQKSVQELEKSLGE